MNKDLKKIYKEDQKDRMASELSGGDVKSREFFEKYIAPRDIKRQEQVLKILKDTKNLDAEDYYNAAMVFQHSVKKQKNAVKFAEKSMDMGYAPAKWLYAASLDRMLLDQGKKQKFGTQFKYLENGKLEAQPTDKRTSDKTREKYNVPPMEEALRELKKFDKKRKKREK